MAKEIKFNEDSRKALVKGVDQLAEHRKDYAGTERKK